MKVNQIQENLKRIIEETEYFDLSRHREANIEARVEYICHLGSGIPYENLDFIFLDGLEKFKESRYWKEYENEDIFEVTLGLSYGLFQDYGLDLNGYKDWAKKQKTIFLPYLLELVGEKIPEFEKTEVKNYFYKQNIEFIMPEEELTNGIIILKESKGLSREFKIIDSFIVFDDNFNKYFELDKEIDDIFTSVYEDFIKEYSLLARSKDLSAFFQNFSQLNEDTMRDLHNQMLRLLRNANAKSSDVKVFSNNFRQCTKDVNLLNALDYLKELVIKSIGEGEIADINWDNEYIRNIDAFFRSMPIGNGMGGLVADLAKRATLNMSEGFIDSAINGIRRIATKKGLELYLKKLLVEEEFLNLFADILYMIEDTFKEDIFKNLNIPFFDLADYEIDRDIIKNVINSHFKKSNNAISDKDIKTILLRSILSCPFDPLIYSTIYSMYGINAGQLNELTTYLEIDEDYRNDVEKYLEVTIKKLSDLSDSTIEEIDKKIQMIHEFANKYGMEDIRDLLKTIEQRKEKMEFWDQIIGMIPGIRKNIDEAFVKGDDNCIWKEGENGNTYAQYILRTLYQYDLNNYINKYGKEKTNEREKRILDDLKIRIKNGSLLACYIYAYIMRKASWSSGDDSLRHMQMENILAFAEKGLTAAIFDAGTVLIEENDDVSKKKGYMYIELAEKAGYPEAFKYEAMCTLEGRCGFAKDIVISEKLFDIARNFGVNCESWITIRENQKYGATKSLKNSEEIKNGSFNHLLYMRKTSN